MNNIIIFQDKVNFVVWKTKGGEHIPIFGKGEKPWASSQTAKWKKEAKKRKEKGTGRYKILSTSELEEWQGKKEYKDWENNLTIAEKTALQNYRATSFSTNSYLRRPELQSIYHPEVLARTKKDIPNLEKSINKGSLSESVMVFRGLDSEEISQNFSKMKGKIIQDKAFVSTTLDRKVTSAFLREENPVLLSIRLAKGTKVASIHSLSAPGKQEAEILLQRNSRFKVTSATKQGKVVKLDVIHLGE